MHPTCSWSPLQAGPRRSPSLTHPCKDLKGTKTQWAELGFSFPPEESWFIHETSSLVPFYLPV